jgi:hypothetical protein
MGSGTRRLGDSSDHRRSGDRPTEPSADLFVQVVGAGGWEPHVERSTRAPREQQLDNAEFVALLRQRLCLSSDRDDEVAAALTTDFTNDETDIVTVWWNT